MGRVSLKRKRDVENDPQAHIYKSKEGRDLDTCHFLYPSWNLSLKLFQSKTQPRKPKALGLDLQKFPQKGLKDPFQTDEALSKLQTRWNYGDS